LAPGSHTPHALWGAAAAPLYFGADGSGPDAPIAMVALGQAAALTAADIHMV